MREWWPILGSKHPIEIEWSPSGKLNIRARHRGDKFWRRGSCSSIRSAEACGRDLLEEESDEEKLYKLRLLRDYYNRRKK